MNEDDPNENDAISDSVSLNAFSMDSFGMNHDDRNEENSKLDQFEDMSEFTMDRRIIKNSIRSRRDDDEEDSFVNARIDHTNNWTYFDSRAIQSQPSGWNNIEDVPLAQEEIIDLFPDPMLQNVCGEINESDTFDESVRDLVRSQSSESTLETNASQQGWWNPTASKQENVGCETQQRTPKTVSNRATLNTLAQERSEDVTSEPTTRSLSADVEDVAVECIALSSTKSEEDSPLYAPDTNSSAENVIQANRNTARYLNRMACKAKQNRRSQIKRVLWSGVVACDSIKEEEEEPSGTFELVKTPTNGQDHAEDTSALSADVQGRQLRVAQKSGKGTSNISDGIHTDHQLHIQQTNSPVREKWKGNTTEEDQAGNSTLTADVSRRDDDDDKFITSIGQHIISALRGAISSYAPYVEPVEATSDAVIAEKIAQRVPESEEPTIPSNVRKDVTDDEETQAYECSIPMQMDKDDNPEQQNETRHESSKWWNRLFQGKDGGFIWGGELVSPEKPGSEESTAEGSNSQCSVDNDVETGVKVPRKRRVTLWPPPEQLNYRNLNEAPVTTLASPTEEMGCRLISAMVFLLFTMAVAMILHESSALGYVQNLYPPPLDVRNRTEFPNFTDYSTEGSTVPPIQSQPPSNGNLLNISMANATIVSSSPSYVVGIHRMRARYGT